MTLRRTSRKKHIRVHAIGVAVAVWVLVVSQSLVCAQTSALKAIGAPDSGLQAAMAKPAESGRIFREIGDRSAGTDWLLMRDAAHPVGPGRLVPVALVRSLSLQSPRGVASDGQTERVKRLPVIHVGDMVVVEEHRAAVEACLEAVALEPAAAGSVLSVRLKMGGKVVRVVAMGPGRTALRETSR